MNLNLIMVKGAAVGGRPQLASSSPSTCGPVAEAEILDAHEIEN